MGSCESKAEECAEITFEEPMPKDDWKTSVISADFVYYYRDYKSGKINGERFCIRVAKKIISDYIGPVCTHGGAALGA
jgi:hypothetical protein